jgi:hypothetical protein
VLAQSSGVVQENGKHLPWKFESLEKEGQEQQNGGEAASHQDFDPTKFILVDKEVIQKIDVMKSKYNLSTMSYLSYHPSSYCISVYKRDCVWNTRQKEFIHLIVKLRLMERLDQLH